MFSRFNNSETQVVKKKSNRKERAEKGVIITKCVPQTGAN